MNNNTKASALKRIAALLRPFRQQANKHAYSFARYASAGWYNQKDKWLDEDGKLLDEALSEIEDILVDLEEWPLHEIDDTVYCDNPGRGY